MGRGGASHDRTDGPERKCIATGEVQPKYGLIRFVMGPDGEIVPDALEKLPGRGIWVSADRGAIEQAVKKRLFGRAARAQVRRIAPVRTSRAITVPGCCNWKAQPTCSPPALSVSSTAPSAVVASSVPAP